VEELQRQRARARRAPDRREEDGAGDHGVPDCFTRSEAASTNSSAIGKYADYLTKEIVPSWTASSTKASRDHRGCFGKSRRLRVDPPRHEVPLDVGRSRGPFGRCVFRFRVLARLAEHAQRARQVPAAPRAPAGPHQHAPARAWRGYRARRRARARIPRGGLAQAQALDGRGPHHHEPVHGRDLRSGSARTQWLPAAVQPRDRRSHHRALEALARARPGEPGCEIPQEPEVAPRDLHRLRRARPCRIHYGSRILSAPCGHGIRHTYEFDDTTPTWITGWMSAVLTRCAGGRRPAGRGRRAPHRK
jgi:hypothetical protein